MHPIAPPTPPPPPPPASPVPAPEPPLSRVGDSARPPTGEPDAGAGEACDPAALPTAPLPATQLPPTHGQLALLALFAGIGVLLGTIGVLRESFGATLLLGLFLCCHAVIVAASWLPRGVLSVRLDAFLDKWVADIGGGYYGLMALAMFGGLEARGLWSDLWDFEFSVGAIGTALVPWLIGFSIDSVMNGIKAALWPVFVASELGTGGAIACALLAWGLFAIGTRVFPQPDFLRQKGRRKT